MAYSSQIGSTASITLVDPGKQFGDAFWRIDPSEIVDEVSYGSPEDNFPDWTPNDLVFTAEAVNGWLILPESPSMEVSNGTNYSEAEVRAILQAIGGIAGDLWTIGGQATQALLTPRPTAKLDKVAPSLGDTEWTSATTTDAPQTSSDPNHASSLTNLVATLPREATSTDASAPIAAKLITKNDVDARQRELLEKWNKLISEGPTVDLATAGALVQGAFDGFKDGIKEGLGGMAYQAALKLQQVQAYSVKGAYHYAQLLPGIRQAGSWWMGYDIGANEEQMLTEAMIQGVTIANNAVQWTKENVKFAVESYTEAQRLIENGKTLLLNALMQGSSAELEKVINSISSRSSEVVRQGLETARTALIELGHVILDLPPDKAGYLLGRIAYEAVESAIVSTVIGMATGASGGAAAPLTGAAGAAYVAKKAEVVAKIGQKLASVDFVKKMPLLVKSLEKLQDIAVMAMRYPMCFVAGTQVHTIDGLKNIETIQCGDWVLTRDENAPASQNRYRQVTELFQTNPRRLFTIAYRNQLTGADEQLTCTGEHPFYVAGRASLKLGASSKTEQAASRDGLNTQSTATVTKPPEIGFIPASELRVGDILALADGQEAVVEWIEEKNADQGEFFTTYNFSVEGDHTYFVGLSGVWVHNSGNSCDEAFEVFVKNFKATDNPISAAKAARDHLDSLVDAKNVGSALYRKHFFDLEQLIVNQFQSEKGSKAWKDYLTGIKGAAPSSMPNPHAHHILFKKGLREAQQKLVQEGQELLRKVGIDPLFGEEVLYWAPNGVKDQHSGSTLLALIEDLRSLAKDSASRSDFARVLKEHAVKAADRR